MTEAPISPTTVLQQLQWRYATKKFDPNRKIPADLWQTLLQSLVLAPSSFGLQPWKFYVIETPELRQALLPHTWNLIATLHGKLTQPRVTFPKLGSANDNNLRVDLGIGLINSVHTPEKQRTKCLGLGGDCQWHIAQSRTPLLPALICRIATLLHWLQYHKYPNFDQFLCCCIGRLSSLASTAQVPAQNHPSWPRQCKQMALLNRPCVLPPNSPHTQWFAHRIGGLTSKFSSA
ncbi:nitroreductase family protein [Thermosynechococcus sp. HY593]|uniref:nitroreductase family protein n=1 Tax=Thermosynechococcus sp. HY593 TaxID=3074103 RepID=UPI0028F45840|nr:MULTISPECIES: nitroreductase family protein [unclassified Thermosynechococcus]